MEAWELLPMDDRSASTPLLTTADSSDRLGRECAEKGMTCEEEAEPDDGISCNGDFPPEPMLSGRPLAAQGSTIFLSYMMG